MKFEELKTWIKSYAVFKKMGGNNFSGYKIISSAKKGLPELEKELMPIYGHYFSAEIEKYKAMPFVQEELSDMPVWVCWWQGMDSMPDVIRICYKRLCKVYSGFRINFICKDTFQRYINIPEQILLDVELGKITITAFSDYLRASLLFEYGGIWMDASVYNVKQFDYHSSTFITAKPSVHVETKSDYIIPSGLWTGFFMGSKHKGCKVFGFLRDSLAKLFLCYDCNPYYFSIDMILRLAYINFPEFQEEIDSIPSNNCDIHHFAGCWNEEFISEDFISLCKDNEVFKLNAKWPVDEKKKNTWHDFFCSDKALYWPQ